MAGLSIVSEFDSRAPGASKRAPASEERTGGARNEFDTASAAVQAALDAGASYADARVMHRRIESMDARNGEIEELNQHEDTGLGVRALVGSSWGFFAVPDLSDAAARRAGRPVQRHKSAVPWWKFWARA